MQVKRLLASLLVSSAIAGLTVGGVQAATVNISGSLPSFPGYGTAFGNNNVISSAGFPTTSGVLDTGTGGLGSTFKGSTIGTPAVVTTDLATYNVDWYFVGGESGHINTLIAPGINPGGSLLNSPTAGEFNEANQNSNCCSPGNQLGPLFLGTSVGETSSTINFTLKDNASAFLANGISNPPPGTVGQESLIFSYLTKKAGLTWELTSSVTDWFLFGFNDVGGPDDNHDDFIGIGFVYTTGANEPVPVPGALVLFASGLLGLTFLGRRRARRSVQVAS